ncbi:MAG: hypothetical protein MUC88_00520 [Planctomycetes bacterium]|jgi:hypothetical protein|nr:hypothetical protein [Planctomycetota bacterium]
MTTPGLQVDQVAPAIIAAPDVVINLLDVIPSGTYSTTSGTFVDVNAEVAGEFVAPLAGTYLLDIMLDAVMSVADTTGRYRIGIDVGGAEEQYLIGDDSSANMQSSAAGARCWRTLVLPVVLTAGSHSIKMQWRRVSGTGSVQVTAGSFIRIYGTLAGGSGAGGTMLSAANASTNPVNISSASFADVAGLSVTINTNAAETVLLCFRGVGWYSAGYSTYTQWVVDGAVVDSPTGSISGNNTATNLERVILYTIPAAGQHVIKLQAKYVTHSWDLYDGRIQVLRFRGGMIPWQKDGVDVVGTPRAVNFIGSGVSLSEGTDKVLNVEMNEALTASGQAVVVVGPQPASDVAIGSGDTQFMPSAGSLAFAVNSTGTYLVQWTGNNFLDSSSNTTGQVKLVFDEGTADEQYIGYNAAWQFRTSGSVYQSPKFSGTVVLSAGNHTLKAYAKETSGTTLIVRGTASAAVGDFTTTLTLVSGSGAGGTLDTVVNKADAAQVVSSASPTFTDLTGMTATVITTTNERVKIVFSVGLTPAAATTGNIAIDIDGSTANNTFFHSDGTRSQNISCSWVSGPLAAGSHTIKLKAYKSSSGDGNFSVKGTPDNASTFLIVTSFRGGLVPVRKDGAQVIDTPAAFDFTGPGCQVTNVGGTAKVSLTGADGAICYSKTDPVDRSLPNDTTTYLIYSGLTTTFYTLVGESVAVALNAIIAGTANRTAGIYYRIDSGSWVHVAQWWLHSVSGSYNFEPAWIVSGLSAGSHTIEFSFRNMDSSSGITTTYGSVTPTRASITQWRGGYVREENVPRLVWASNSTIQIAAQPGCSTELRACLNNGARYTAAAPLTWDITVSGLGGLDTGSEAASTWYYLYLVPSAVAGQMSIVGSVASPAGGGPTGYPIWRYIGAVRNNASSNLRKFWQAKDWFYFEPNTDSEMELYSVTAGAQTGAWVDRSTQLATAVPAAMAGAVEAQAFMDADGTDGWIAWVEPGNPPGYTPGSAYNDRTWSLGALNNDVQCGGTRNIVPLFDGTISIWTMRHSGSGSLDYAVTIRGYQDKYLLNPTAQIAGKYTPDTKLPTLTYSAAGAVNVAAAAGAPSTVLLTLQDAKQRYFSGTLAWAFANGVADLGLDTGSEASSTWYYLYAVPKTGDDNQLSVRASVTGPATGPTGYTNWKYLGAFRNDGSSNIIPFYQTGSTTYFAQQQQAVTLASGTDGSPVSASLAAYIPVTASLADLFMFYQSAGGIGLGYIWVDGQQGSGGANDQWQLRAASGDATYGGDTVVGMIPTPSTPKTIYYQRTVSCNSGRISVRGWVDQYLA